MIWSGESRVLVENARENASKENRVRSGTMDRPVSGIEDQKDQNLCPKGPNTLDNPGMSEFPGNNHFTQEKSRAPVFFLSKVVLDFFYWESPAKSKKDD